jgi:uncharacterized protein YndB with AHSA1/START domain
MPDDCPPVTVSRRIAAPASDVFRVLADPAAHPALDGSRMLRDGAPAAAITGVGEVFTMKMHVAHLGDYEMDNHVVEFAQDRRIGWEPAAGRGHPQRGSREGHRWTFILEPDGPGATVVTESYDCSAASRELRDAVANGTQWIPAMTATLERLDQLCTGHLDHPADGPSASG